MIKVQLISGEAINYGQNGQLIRFQERSLPLYSIHSLCMGRTIQQHVMEHSNQ